MYNPTFIGDIDLNEETLAHFGIKGMKWGKRKVREAVDKLRGRRRKKGMNYQDSRFQRQTNGINVRRDKRYTTGPNHKANAAKYGSKFDQHLTRAMNANTHAERMALFNAANNDYSRSHNQEHETTNYDTSYDKIRDAKTKHRYSNGQTIATRSSAYGDDVERGLEENKTEFRKLIDYENNRSKYRKKK